LWAILEEEAVRLGLPERTILALFDAAQRLRVRNSVYQAHAELSEYAGGRDLKRLVNVELLEPHGEKRGRYYTATARLLQLAQAARELGREWEREDPFGPVQQELALTT
jgi:hypothetical protein